MQLSKSSLAGSVVLVVDHDPMSRDILRIFLTGLGATVLDVPNHDECFPVIGAHEVNAVIVEPYRPGIAATDFLAQLKSVCSPAVRVIITTTDAALTAQKEDLAVHEVFLKPYHVAQVATSLIS